MRPDSNAINILSTTRATAKMHEFRVAPEDFIRLPRNPPAMLFALAVGLLGDVAATIADLPLDEAAPLGELPVPRGWGETGPSPVDGLRFASVFFDAFLNARLDDTVTVELSLLCASAYYLAGNVGSAAVIVRQMHAPELELAGGLGRLVHSILANAFVPIDGEHAHTDHTLAIPMALGGYTRFENDATTVRDACAALRGAAYANGSPRELLYADLVSAICASKLRNAARTMLPAGSDLTPDAWRAALAKPHFPIELWPAQQRIAAAGLLRGLSAVIQMPTSAGKTRATELIIRSAFLANRASLAVIVAPYRSLCHSCSASCDRPASRRPLSQSLSVQHHRCVEGHFPKVDPLAAAVDNHELMVGDEHDQGVMPSAAGIIDPLAPAGAEGAQGVRPARVRSGGDDDDPGVVLQRQKRLGAQRVALHHRKTQRGRARLTSKNVDERPSALGGDIDAGKIMETLGKAGIDGEVLAAVGLDDIAEGSEAFARQWLDVDGNQFSSTSSGMAVD